MAEAVQIAKGNAEFSFAYTVRVQGWPIKGSERTTGFVYPTEGKA